MASSTLLPPLSSTLTDQTNNGTLQGLPMSTRITISVLAGVAAFGLIIIAIVLICLLLQSSKAKKRKKSREQNSSNTGSHRNQMAPFHSNFRSSNVVHPPGRVQPYGGHFREYDNWAYTARNEELGVYPDVISDLNRKKLAGNKEIKWTTTSLRAHDNYDYERYGRIPRAKLYERKEELTS